MPLDEVGHVAVPTSLHGQADATDEQILAAVRNGDQDRFGEIYGRYAASVRRFARTLVDRDDVDDVVAEAFVKTLHALGAGKGPTDHAIAYLMVAVRTAAATLQAKKVRSTDLAESMARHIETTTDLQANDDHLFASFRSLPERWRQVIWLTTIEDLPISEIAERLNLDPPAVSSLAYRARQGLRAAYAAQEAAASIDRERST